MSHKIKSLVQYFPGKNIPVKFEVEYDAANAEQKKAETKIALREMGLDENL